MVLKDSVVINGPFAGKRLKVHDITRTIIFGLLLTEEHNFIELKYYRTKQGFAWHSWRRVY